MGLPITSVEQGIVTIDFNLAHLAEHLASSHELRRELRSGAIDYTSTNPSHVYSLSEDRGRRTVQLFRSIQTGGEGLYGETLTARLESQAGRNLN